MLLILLAFLSNAKSHSVTDALNQARLYSGEYKLPLVDRKAKERQLQGNDISVF